MTDTERPTLIVDKLHAALARRTKGRLHEATCAQLAASLDEAGLHEAPTSIIEEALTFVIDRWKRQCHEEMAVCLTSWEPTEAERARPH